MPTMNTLTLASSAQTINVTVDEIVGLSTLTVTSTAVTNSVSIGNVGIVLSSVTLSSSAVAIPRVKVFLLSPTEISNLRTTSHKADVRVTIIQPTVLWSGQINSPGIARGAVTFATDNGTGSLTNVRSYQQVLVGTVPGGRDVAVLRLDEITGVVGSPTITVDENAVVWKDNYYVTILHHYPIERIVPRISGGVFYKFYDLAYSNQNNSFTTKPVVIAGPDRVLELSGGSAKFDFDLSQGGGLFSYSMVASEVLTSYGLSVAPSTGATVSFNTGTGQGDVTVTQAGTWWVTADVTDGGGNTNERFVVIHAVDPAVPPTYLTAKISSYNETAVGAIRFGLTVEQDTQITLDDYPDNAIVILWYDNKFDEVSGYADVFKERNSLFENILFNGYLRKEKITSSLSDGLFRVQFEVTNIAVLLESLPMRSISLRNKLVPSHWYEYSQLSTGQAIWYLLIWHTTVPRRHDIFGFRDFDFDWYRAAADLEEGSIASMIDKIASRGVVAHFYCDRLGRFHFKQDPQLLNKSERDKLLYVMDIVEQDVSGAIDLVRDPEETVHNLQLSGFKGNFASGQGDVYISIIPGYRPTDTSFTVPARRGRSFKNIPSQVLQSQQDANERAGRYFAQANMPVKEIRVTFRGNYFPALSTVPIGWYELGIANSSLARDLNLNRIRMLCRAVSMQYSYETGVMKTTATFEPEAFGPDGIQGNYPDSIPAPSLPAPPVDEIQAPAEGVLVTQSAYFRKIEPEETGWNALHANSSHHTIIDPWWQINNETIDPADIILLSVHDGLIEVHDLKAETVTDRTPLTDPPNTWSDGTPPTAATVTYSRILADKWLQDRWYVSVEKLTGATWRSWIAYTSDRGLNWNWIDLYNGYTLESEARIRSMTVNGTYLLLTVWEDGNEYVRAYRKSDFIGVVRTLTTVSDNAGENATNNSSNIVGVTDDDNLWVLFGNMLEGPGAWSGSTVHVCATTDAGSSWKIIESGVWGSGKVIALRVSDLSAAGDRRIWLELA